MTEKSEQEMLEETCREVYDEYDEGLRQRFYAMPELVTEYLGLLITHVDEAGRQTSVAINEATESSENPKRFRELEHLAVYEPQICSAMNDMEEALKLILSARERLVAVCDEFIEKGEVTSDFSWMRAKNEVFGTKRLDVVRGYLGGAEYDGPNPMFLGIGNEVTDEADQKAISAIFEENGFIVQHYDPGTEWTADPGEAWYLSLDREIDTLYRIDQQFRALGFGYVEWSTLRDYDRDGNTVDIQGEIDRGAAHYKSRAM
ncbi:hypothetical protein ELG63_36260 [Rhizobium leguminosarum]|uniref:hypothetical protein n=1 Tax=Rhizobium leguminosarum TaxID=384 RepID=UPI00102F51C3|nr:hypothetical protein [Rhizobium leguminosarum]TBH28143.1 hypothetical protein ELG63_36260 [Rhizobium leguminosarum]